MINISREIKIKLDDKDDIINKLRKSSAILLGGIKEVTTRYDDLNSNYEKSGKYIRTRTGFKNIISLKEKLQEDKDNLLTRNDIEVEVSNIKKMQYILENLGLYPVLVMEKYRLKWIYEKREINLDELFF